MEGLRTGSVINLMPSHSLQCSVSLAANKSYISRAIYRIVVAVPTKSKLAFSPPAFLGWTLVSLASGSELGSLAPAGRSRVGGCAVEGSMVRCLGGSASVRPMLAMAYVDVGSDKAMFEMNSLLLLELGTPHDRGCLPSIIMTTAGRC